MSEANESMMEKKKLDEEKGQHQSQGGLKKGLRGKRKNASFISSTPNKSKGKRKENYLGEQMRAMRTIMLTLLWTRTLMRMIWTLMLM